MDETKRPLYMTLRAMGPDAFEEIRKKTEHAYAEGFYPLGGSNVWMEYGENDLKRGVVHVSQTVIRREMLLK